MLSNATTMGHRIFNIIVVLAVGALLIYLVPRGCTRPKQATRILTQQGYTEIEITGWRPFMADKNETFSTGFRARSQSGDIVTGAVTSGILKGNTIRLD